MPESHPDRILVRAAVEHDLPADRAEVELIVSGSSFFSGSAALARAKEVRDVVGTLTELGVPADDVSLLDVVAESSKGLITTTSSATS